jgi:hypothetical protein
MGGIGSGQRSDSKEKDLQLSGTRCPKLAAKRIAAAIRADFFLWKLESGRVSTARSPR